jgi:hypothetical protein
MNLNIDTFQTKNLQIETRSFSNHDNAVSTILVLRWKTSPMLQIVHLDFLVTFPSTYVYDDFQIAELN